VKLRKLRKRTKHRCISSWVWDDLLQSSRVTIEDFALDKHQNLTPLGKAMRILLFEHGTDAYKKLVQNAKILTPLI
jgi:hypothetical protein